MKRALTVSAIAAVSATGIAASALAIAAPAMAGGTNNKVTIDGPRIAIANKAYKVDCQTAPSLVGQPASIQEKGLPFHANTRVTSSGSCDMTMIAQATGNQQIRVIVKKKNGKLAASNWEDVKVVAAKP